MKIICFWLFTANRLTQFCLRLFKRIFVIDYFLYFNLQLMRRGATYTRGSNDDILN